ncbi:MAG: AAC(3) family N-acetyltransferase [Oscillospiraceae bacterium]|nr:AAC(3) family N-acetyltransferase [Oscillospiraceae bacterium]
MVTSQQVREALIKLGIKEGDSILTHSSFKSLGETENGAATVVEGMKLAVGEDGTVLFPTLCQKDWPNVYKNWNMDAESDVGYLTNYFRKLPEALRSNQATHSVAAIGKKAAYVTETHGETGRRYGIFGDTPFSADSPWEKMYHIDTKVVFLGVGIRKCTFRHFAEYCFMEDCLKRAEGSSEYDRLKGQVWCYENWDAAGVWPHLDSEYIQTVMEKRGMVHKATCGNAELLMVSSEDFVDISMELLKNKEKKALLENHDIWTVQTFIDWVEEIEKL